MQIYGISHQRFRNAQNSSNKKMAKIWPKIQPHDDETENKYASSFKEFEWN